MAPAGDPERPAGATPASRRGRLLRKYVAVFAGLVSAALLASGLLELYISYLETQTALVALQREKAQGAAARIEAFVREIERQMGWITQPSLASGAAALEQRRVDGYRLQRQVRAITDLAYLDSAGREQLRISRLAMEVAGSQADFSADPRFTEARAGRTWFGPVYFRKESEPYMSIAMPLSGGAGVTVAEVNLKFIWDVVSEIRIGKAGRAYVVDVTGTLVAHPDISLVLRKTSLASLPHVQATLAGPGRDPSAPAARASRDLDGHQVLTAHAAIAPLRWTVFAEQPLAEALEPLNASIKRTVLLLGLGVALSAAAGLLLARRMVRPIRTLDEGAARIGAGELGHRITVETGDELEALAEQFNRMTAQLQESYATLERRVQERTRELSEALEQQTATAEVLRIISGLPTDLAPVYQTILENITRLCEANIAALFLYDGERLGAVATHGTTPEFAEHLRRNRPRPSRETTTRLAALERRPVHIADLLSDPAFSPNPRDLYERENVRTVLSVPMLREDTLVGVITAWRRDVRPFTDTQVALVQTFADQAVIAIENVRLFQELQARNRDITEALKQQTATAEILRVISSSPTDFQPVMAVIAENAARVCAAYDAGVFLRDGETMRLAAHHGPIPFIAEGALPLSWGLVSGRTILEARPVQVEDLASAEEFAEGRDLARQFGYRTTVAVPLVREGQALGAIVIRRREVRPFADKQVALLKTFADQAVIAIENVRLFQELEARNRDITEALEQQTATAEILRAISRSQTDVQPVFDTICEKAQRLCRGSLGSAVYAYDGQLIHLAAYCNWTPEMLAQVSRRFPQPAGDLSLVSLSIQDGRVAHVQDLEADPTVPAGSREAGRTLGYRSQLVVPMLRDGKSIGAIVVARAAPGGFSGKEVALLQTFADQAVIAVENVRLLQELQARTAELTRSVEELEALGEVGRAVSSSLDLETVLATIVSRASQLSGAEGGVVYEYDEAADAFVLRATQNLDPELVQVLQVTPLRRGEGAVGRMAETRQPVQIPDTLAETYRSPVRDLLARTGYRAILAVPLLREDRIIGGLLVNRRAPGAFDPRVVELLQTFATQSALALQNARLFQEIEEKSRQLEIANRHKSEFLANMSHELRTPLNAIIGFSEVLVERMFGEINAKQEEYLRDIYESGRHLLSLINDILDLSKVEAGRMELERSTFDLPQAIQNALTLVRGRAEAHGIRLGVALDPRLGDFVGDERKVKQILVNLLSNAVKFTPEGGRVEVQAVLADAAVEIAVSDTGVGIAPEDQEAVFEAFRQVGGDAARKREGTGLGLSLTRRFVELHGGSIWVKSVPGRGSTFTFTLPVRPWPAS